MSTKILDNGTVLTLGLVGAVAAIGAATKAGVYGSRASVTRDDFRTSHLRGDARKLAEAIKKLVRDMNGEEPDGGGSVAFVTPAQRRRLGYDVSKNVVLVLVHDGGDLAPFLNPYYDVREKYEAMRELLRRMGYATEMENSAVTHVFKR